MDVEPIVLNEEELGILKRRTGRFADWVWELVMSVTDEKDELKKLKQEDKENIMAEEENILTARQYWWNRRDYKWFVLFPIRVEFELGLGNAPNAWFDHVAELLVARKDNDMGKEAESHYNIAEDYFYNSVGDTFFEKLGVDRLEEAIREYKEALAIDPNNIQIRYGLIGILNPQGVGRGRDAVDECLEMLKINPENGTTFHRFDLSHYYKGIELLYYLSLVEDHEREAAISCAFESLNTILAANQNNWVARRELERLLVAYPNGPTDPTEEIEFSKRRSGHMEASEIPKINCAICGTQLRISLAAGQEGFVAFRVSDLGGPEKLIEELKKPARYLCPKCKVAYCPYCLPELLCPNCKTRVGLG